MERNDVVLDDLAREYRELGRLKKTVRAEVRADFEEQIRREIERRIGAAEMTFAHRLAEAKDAYGLKVTDIMDQVLHSRAWNRWSKWRELAGMKPERVVQAEIRQAKADDRKPYRIEDGKIIVLRNASGPVEPFEILEVRGGRAWGYNGISEGGEHYEDQVNFRKAFNHLDSSGFTSFLRGAFEEYGDDFDSFDVSGKEF